jgi:LPS-assembly lipoprotein
MNAGLLWRFWLGLGCAILLSGCGWQLRGLQSQQGPNALFLQPEDKYAPLALAVKEVMRSRAIAASPEAPLHLHLGSEVLKKRVVAVTTIGSPAQFEMALSTTYYYQTPADPFVSPPLTASVERVLDFDPSSTVAKREEENTLVEEMRRDLAHSILQRARLYQGQAPTQDNPAKSAEPLIIEDLTHGQNQP